MESFRDLSQVEQLQKELQKSYTFEDIVSKSSSMQKIFDVLPTIARSDSTVLIEGDSGTGKELIARAIHNLSPRNRNPLVAVNCGALQDLYYLINIMRIVMPSLKERMEDIPILVDHFIGKFNRIHDKDIDGISPEALKILMNHNYPGNVRELENIFKHSFVLCAGGMILPQHLSETLIDEPAIPPTPAFSMNDLKASFILASLERNSWNRQATAEELGIHKTTLYRKIRKLKIVLPKHDGRSNRRSEE